MMTALDDIASLGGLEPEKDYPYTGEEGQCRFDKKKAVISDVGSTYVYKNELRLKELVAVYGPVAVSIYATVNFFEYHGGVFEDDICDREYEIEHSLNHALLLVGYGTDPKLGDYWIVKNSWGESFGEKGYIRIRRGADTCGISSYGVIATFP